VDFQQWQDQTKDYLHKKNLDPTRLGYFTEKVISKIDNRFRGIENLTSVEVTANAVDPIALPADYLETSVLVISGAVMGQTPPGAVMSDKRFAFTTSTGYYIDADNLIQTARTVIGVDYRLDYYQRSPAMVNPTDTTPVMQKYPDLYLYGSMFEASLYLEDWDTATNYKGLFENIIEDARRAAWRYRWSGSVAVRGM
jgi:hypothetical protein